LQQFKRSEATMAITITREDTGSKASYLAKVDGFAGEGILTISVASGALVIADHTSVSDDLRGQGIAKALTERLVTDARAQGQKILPLCPYVKGYMDRHPEETRDVRAS
jgi:predicted GNAT family acetyltransferase